MTTAAIYSRVSTQEQVESYSLDAQRRACRDFCSARGFAVVQEYADEGVSAHTDDLRRRPAFSAMLADAEAGRFNLIVVHKMDRFARRQKVHWECLERLAKAHVGLASVSEPDLDYSTPQGFFFMSMLGTLAEWYSRNLSTETKKGWRERKARGLYAGRLPWGVVKGPDGIPAPDLTLYAVDGRELRNHDGLVLAFERAAMGEADTKVALHLNAVGYRPNPTAPRQRFTREGLRTILQNRFYVGELPVGKRGQAGWVRAAHEPIVDPELFERVQRERRRRHEMTRPLSVATSMRTHPLSGLVRCHCGERMHLEAKDRLMCFGRRQGTGCTQPSVLETAIVGELGLWLRQLRFPATIQQQIIDAYTAHRPEAGHREAERARTTGQLNRLADLYLLGDIGREAYERQRAALRQQIANLVERDTHAQPEVVSGMLATLANAAGEYLKMPGPRQNAFAREFFEYVTVRDQHLETVQPRADWQPLFALAGTSTTGRARGDSNPKGCNPFVRAEIGVGA